MAKFSRVELYKRGIDIVKSGKVDLTGLQKDEVTQIKDFMKANGDKLKFDLFKQDILTKIVELEKAQELGDTKQQTFLTTQIKEVLNSTTYWRHAAKDIQNWNGSVEDIRTGLEGNSRLSALAAKMKG